MPRWQEVPVAYVVRAAGATASADAVLDSVLPAQLARYKVPREFVFVEALPRNALGKVQHFLLRQEAQEKAQEKRVRADADCGPGRRERLIRRGRRFRARRPRRRLWRRDNRRSRRIAPPAARSGQGFSGRREAKLALVTNDIGEAVRGAELILCPAPATAQADIAKRARATFADGQVVFLPPGTFGSMLFAKAAHDAGNRAEVAFAETGTLPWLTRKHGPFEAADHGARQAAADRRVSLALEGSCAEDHRPGVSRRDRGCGDALSGALMNAGPIIHPPLIIMNAGPLEHFERWDIHKEGTQVSIRRVTDALDDERIAVREALGYGRRISRSPIITPRRARNGCMAVARTNG